jgi:hypothetical protein
MGQKEAKPGRVRRFHDDGTAPADGQVFVFGSNLSGRHAGGAARAAADLYGAADGISEGLTGRSYALPTVQADLAGPLPLEAVAEAVARFLAFAQANPDTSFHVTRVGCGIAGFTDEQIAPLFAAAPDNCSLPKPWESFVGITTFKGFSRSWTCNGDFQFEPGKTYEHEGVVKACGGGFHACEYPLDVFAYYAPADSRFALVEQSGGLDRHDADSKVASQRISIKAELTISGLISAAFEYVKSRCTPATSEHVTGDSSASSATGDSRILSVIAMAPKAEAPDARDAARLDFLDHEANELRTVATAEDDFDWVVVSLHMSEPRERELGRGKSARSAIDAALAAQPGEQQAPGNSKT